MVTSNVLATLALHSLYFVLVDRAVASQYPHIGIGLVFVIIGAKMLVQNHVHVPHAILLASIAAGIGIGVTGPFLDARGTSE